ncbi:hypothetical protein VN12_03775 [Pirellula sp. SH-Sr6A]|uniref:hypothetical protein n=1 Tax=Pirellula sp. SH-Sr6A TaxID=1632865 RepID=UPI00078C4B20|nr:hypothetical protein [Pirellula sp. SH-Sr6A]AMV31212.1 hypothetical protein VN12_03775 [Pirellula sp. SH-Sr6A]
MKSMKFASLILLCATSSLALILPALGVVSFPQQLIKNSDLPSTMSPPGPDGVPPGGWQSAQGGLPIATSIPNSSLGTPAPIAPPSLATQPRSPPSLDPMAHGHSTFEPNIVSDEKNPNKVGTGLWLLLGPVWLASLAMWTIAPGPKTGKK